MKTVKLKDLPIQWLRGKGLRKSDVCNDGKNECILYGELFTKYKDVVIDNHRLSRTDSASGTVSRAGDLLVPGTSTAAKSEMVRARVVKKDGILIGGDINIIRPERSLFEAKYLAYFFETLKAKRQLDRYITGTTGIIHISNSGIKNLDVPIVPIEEQRRVVERLDAAFEKIDRAIELTEENIQLSKQLFNDKLSATFREGGNKWNTERLDKFCVLQRGHDLPKSERVPGTYKLASSSGIIDTHNSFRAKGPGVFTGRSGSIGGVFYEEGDYWPLNTVLFVKQFYDNEPKLIYYLIKSLDFKKYAGGTGVPTLNRNDVHSLVVSLPIPGEQHALVNRLDSLSATSQNLVGLYSKKLFHLKSLKQSLLSQAFSGSDVE